MSTHNICFRREIRKLFTWYPLLSRPMINYINLLSLDYMSCAMQKSVFRYMQTLKAQISLCIPAVRSGPSLSANRIIGHYRMYQWKANAWMRLCPCVVWILIFWETLFSLGTAQMEMIVLFFRDCLVEVESYTRFGCLTTEDHSSMPSFHMISHILWVLSLKELVVCWFTSMSPYIRSNIVLIEILFQSKSIDCF